MNTLRDKPGTWLDVGSSSSTAQTDDGSLQMEVDLWGVAEEEFEIERIGV